MRQTWLPLTVVGVVLVVAFSWIVMSRIGGDEERVALHAPAPDARLDDVMARLEETERRSSALERDIAELRRALARANERRPVGEVRIDRPTAPNVPGDSARDSVVQSIDSGEHGPDWYLDQYVASFQDDGEGSEFLRLAVEAFAAELVDRILGYALQPSQPLACRIALIEILGKKRFKGDRRIVDVLVGALPTAFEDDFFEALVSCIGDIGDATTIDSLEGLVFRIAERRQRLLDLVVGLAGPETNRVLSRLFGRAPDDDAKIDVVRRLDTDDAESALEVYRRVLGERQPVRLAGAREVGKFTMSVFKQFVTEWIAIETDEDVLAALGASKDRQRSGANWSAQRATGAPDTTDINADSNTAWASQNPDSGNEWLELTYDPPRTAHGVRIHEVCAAGAVVEVVTIDKNGGWRRVWRGTDPLTAPGVFECTFPETGYAVAAVRIILDTRIGKGWNEIDAVELLSREGNLWADSAKASSNYGGPQQVATFQSTLLQFGLLNR